jgi:acetyl-CoA acyltransferase
MRDAVIIDAVRTPIGKGKPGGALSSVHPVDLLAHALRGLVERTGIEPATIDDVIGGCVSREIGADLAKVNVHGGAIALGHPLGASGARITTTLLHAMQTRNAHWALQTICEAGGTANAAIIERLSR